MNSSVNPGTSANALVVPSVAQMTEKRTIMTCKAKIWIDLENSPHVPFFAPIREELLRRGYSVLLTARDCFQVRELADLFHLDYHLIGHHHGKSNVRKMAGLCLRALKLIPLIRRERPDLAVSHGSRSQLIACSLMGLPSLFVRDYEFTTPLPLLHPTWLMCPEVIPIETLQCDPRRIMKYPGIKEDVYVPRFVPDSRIRAELGLSEEDLVATIRPPASEAHYRNPQSQQLFDAAVAFLSRFSGVKQVVLPRNEKQAIELRGRWNDLFANGTMRIPAQVVDGLNMIWHSDLVISGGGTMNREAAALGVPVYSVFRGTTGAVDRYLSERGRLVLLQNVEEVQTKIRLVRRNRPAKPEKGESLVLNQIVEQIVSIVDKKRALPRSTRGVGLSEIASVGSKAAREFGGAEVTK